MKHRKCLVSRHDTWHFWSRSAFLPYQEQTNSYIVTKHRKCLVSRHDTWHFWSQSAFLPYQELNRSSRVWLLCMDAAGRIKLWSKQLKSAEIRRFERPKLVGTCLKVPTFDCEKGNPKDLLKVVLSPKDWKVLSLTRAGQHWEPTRGKETNHVPAWNCDSQ